MGCKDVITNGQKKENKNFLHKLLETLRKWTCAERAFISIPGTVKQITGTEKIKAEIKKESSMPNIGVNDFFLRITEGSKVSFPENNVTKCGNIIACAPDRQMAVNMAETAARSILIRLDPACSETRSFLNLFPADLQKLKKSEESNENNSKNENEINFPPDAFQLTDKLKSALLKIPDEIKLNNTYMEKSCGSIFESHTRGVIRSFENSSYQILITPFPEFTASCLTDYMGRTAEDALEAVRLLTGASMPGFKSISDSSENAENKIILGRSFWTALIRGSYQGAVYYIDNLLAIWEL